MHASIQAHERRWWVDRFTPLILSSPMCVNPYLYQFNVRARKLLPGQRRYAIASKQFMNQELMKLTFTLSRFHARW